MNRLLIAVFDNETAANAGLQALHPLHAQGDGTVYATGVIAKDAAGQVSLNAIGGQILQRTRAEVAQEALAV